MDEQDLHDALDGLMAYDLGATDSGIHDELLRKQVKRHLRGLNKNDFRITISRWMRGYLADEMLDQGYGIEDVRCAIDWLSDSMDTYV